MLGIKEYLCRTYDNDHDEWLWGDSGYLLESWLITPIGNLNTDDEIRFNTVHSAARSIVERAIGVLKGRWRCLCKQRMLHYKPTVCVKIINACVALHNICLAFNDGLPQEDIIYEPDVSPPGLQNYNYAKEQAHAMGHEKRLKIINFINSWITILNTKHLY